MKKMNILYQSSDEFSFMVGTSLTSLLENAVDTVQYNIFILTPDMSEVNKNRFVELVNRYSKIQIQLEFLDANYCKEEVLSWNVPAHRGSYITYYKLLLDHYFCDTDVDKILHIGGDTLVLGSLEELCDFDFQGNPIAMNWSSREFERHFPFSYKYRVAEMVYFNLSEWRKHNCEDRIKRHFIEIGDIYGSKDQGILNMEFQFECQQLPLKYNIYGLTYNFSFKNKRRFNDAPIITDKEIEEAYLHPEIVHLPRTFLYRPHEKGSMEPLKEVWWKYINISPWNGKKEENPMPPLGAKERFIRKLYLQLPAFLAQPFYIYCRRGFGIMIRLFNKPLKKSKRCIGYIN